MTEEEKKARHVESQKKYAATDAGKETARRHRIKTSHKKSNVDKFVKSICNDPATYSDW